MQLGQGIVLLASTYVGLGMLVAPIVLFRSIERFDPAAAGSSLGFRLIVLPGSVLLWPLLARRVIRGPQVRPLERNAHRVAAAARRADRGVR